MSGPRFASDWTTLRSSFGKSSEASPPLSSGERPPHDPDEQILGKMRTGLKRATAEVSEFSGNDPR
jgi:hypothetical protein